MAVRTVEEAVEWGKSLDFPTVWAAIMESRVNIDKLGERIDQLTVNTTANGEKLDERIDRLTENGNKLDERIDRLTENGNKLDERIDRLTENGNKLDERIDRLTENINKLGERVDRVTANVGGLNQSFGELIETLFTPHLGEKFDRYHYGLKRMFKRLPIYDNTSRLRGEIDILLSNTTVCMAVEVKRWLEKTDQIDEHIRRMQLIREYPPAEANGKKLLGAMAAATVLPDAREYAEQNGFFVLELTGEDIRLLEPPEGFQPSEW